MSEGEYNYISIEFKDVDTIRTNARRVQEQFILQKSNKDINV